jgi:hypothetical protein
MNNPETGWGSSIEDGELLRATFKQQAVLVPLGMEQHDLEGDASDRLPDWYRFEGELFVGKRRHGIKSLGLPNGLALNCPAEEGSTPLFSRTMAGQEPYPKAQPAGSAEGPGDCPGLQRVVRRSGGTFSRHR